MSRSETQAECDRFFLLYKLKWGANRGAQLLIDVIVFEEEATSEVRR